MELANRLLLGRLFCACNLVLLGTQLRARLFAGSRNGSAEFPIMADRGVLTVIKPEFV